MARMRWRRSGAVLAVGVVVLAGFLCGRAGAQGLKLDTATEKTGELYDRPNPHFELDCSECHGADRPAEGATWETVKFVNGEEGNVKLCYTCHDPSDNIHPIDVDPTLGKPPVKIPKDFPLEKVGAKKGTVVCSTCHFIHAKTAGLKLLRGFPESSLPADIKKARFRDRRELCKACHGAALKDKSPHKGKVVVEGEKGNCSFCHAKEPKAGEEVKFTKNPVELCDFCHAATKGAHFLLVNPFADPNLAEEIKKVTLPMYGGEYTCITCHNPHGGTGEQKFIRKEFVALALKSARVRPHFLRAFCEACHTVRPAAMKGEPGAPKLADIPLRSTDMNALCNRCHESGLSKSNAHPLKKVVGKYAERMPKGWPLQNGELTCLTCHTGGDSPVFDPDNPNFLRDGPYISRNDVCWKCHVQAEFREVDPHEMINRMEGCEFCHASRPDPDKMDQDVKFKGDIVILCLRCHGADPHPASHDHTGVPNKEFMAKEKIIIPKEFPLDWLGRMTCATCHNQHAYGELRGAMQGMMVCTNCHKK